MVALAHHQPCLEKKMPKSSCDKNSFPGFITTIYFAITKYLSYTQANTKHELWGPRFSPQIVPSENKIQGTIITHVC